MENQNIEIIEGIQSQRMYLQLQELKILLRNAKDSVTGKILLDCTLEGQIRNILESLLKLKNDELLVGACLILYKALGIKTTVKILNDRGDYGDEYCSIFDRFTFE